MRNSPFFKLASLSTLHWKTRTEKSPAPPVAYCKGVEDSCASGNAVVAVAVGRSSSSAESRLLSQPVHSGREGGREAVYNGVPKNVLSLFNGRLSLNRSPAVRLTAISNLFTFSWRAKRLVRALRGGNNPSALKRATDRDRLVHIPRPVCTACARANPPSLHPSASARPSVPPSS